MPTLQISSLIPKRDTVDFGDGVAIEIKSWSEMHALDMGHLSNLQGQAQELIEAARDGASDPEVQAERIVKLHECLDAHLLYLMPDLQPEALEPLALSAKQGVITWWRAQYLISLEKNEDDDPNSEGQG